MLRKDDIMKIEFVKMQGTGNDYIYIDCINNNLENKILPRISEVSKILSNRRMGIGSDGVILICKSDDADFKMRMFNSDGSEGKMCGNGIRCIGKYVYEKGYTGSKEITVETLSGIKSLLINEKDKLVDSVEVDMGTPIFTPKDIPVLIDKERVIDEEIDIGDVRYRINCLSMGNPHCVVFLDDIENIDIESIGPKFENNKIFPDRINTEFVRVVSDNKIEMRVWERGSGETLSCGTGSCASVVACVENGLCKKNEFISVILKGGILEVKYLDDNSVILKGPAEYVFEGVASI